MERDYNLGCINYIPAGIFYLLSLFLTIGVFFSFVIDSNINILIRIIFFTIYLFLLSFTLYYHFKSMTISNKIDYDTSLINNQNEIEENKNYCTKCKSNRPKRSHHCRVCGVCILKMDHHCPWIANCVGEKNEREFIYFLMGCTMSSIFAFFLTIKYFIFSIKNREIYNYNFQDSYFLLALKDIIKCFKFYCCPISFALGLTIFFIVWNFINNNVKYNMTCIEMLSYRNYEDCPDYKNNLAGNLQRILKPYPLIINLFIKDSDNINEDFNYIKIDEENHNLLNKE